MPRKTSNDVSERIREMVERRLSRKKQQNVRSPECEEQILALIRQGYSIGNAAIVAGVGRLSLSKWQAADPEFAQKIRDAQERYAQGLLRKKAERERKKRRRKR